MRIYVQTRNHGPCQAHCSCCSVHFGRYGGQQGGLGDQGPRAVRLPVHASRPLLTTEPPHHHHPPPYIAFSIAILLIVLLHIIQPSTNLSFTLYSAPLSASTRAYLAPIAHLLAMPAQRPRRWVEAAALLITMPFVALAADSSLIPYTQTSYAASAQCTVEGNNWILYIGNSAAPYAWDAAQNPDGSEFRRRIPLMHLHTTAPHQTITCQVFGTGIDVLGGLQVPRDFNSSAPNILNVSLDGQVLSNKDAISLFPKEEGWESTFLKLPPTGATPLTDSLHTLRIQTGPAWRGALKMWGMSANTTIPTE